MKNIGTTNQRNSIILTRRIQKNPTPTTREAHEKDKRERGRKQCMLLFHKPLETFTVYIGTTCSFGHHFTCLGIVYCSDIA